MRPIPTTRKASVSQDFSQPTRTATPGFDQPGAFQCTILRALDLPQPLRDVFLLSEIQGHTLEQIAAILGITLATTQVRLMHARREIGCLWDSDAMGRAQ